MVLFSTDRVGAEHRDAHGGYPGDLQEPSMRC